MSGESLSLPVYDKGIDLIDSWLKRIACDEDTF